MKTFKVNYYIIEEDGKQVIKIVDHPIKSLDKPNRGTLQIYLDESDITVLTVKDIQIACSVFSK